MKLLVFAHTPPPHHGQSYMVKLMLDAFGGDRRAHKAGPAAPTSAHGLECYHVNARLSRDDKDIGGLRPGKLFLLFGYCLEAVWCRFRHGVKTMYYVPAPGKLSAVLRDWMVMVICRPFFPRLILHWHAAGLSHWLDTAASGSKRSITRRLLRQPDLSIVMSDVNRADGEWFQSRRIAVARLGIADPCPKFDAEILPRRQARLAAREKGAGAALQVLFLAHCMREKGLFDALDGALLANEQWRAEGSPMRLYLTLAGAFHSETDRAEFQNRLEQAGVSESVRWLGFVSGEQKRECLEEADVLCFPTYYFAENQPVTIIEAMAFGLPMVTTHWRAIPDMLPQGYAGLVAPKSPTEVARALRELASARTGPALRRHFLRYFTLDQHVQDMAAAIHQVEEE